MSAVNKTIRFFGYVGIYLITFLKCYMISLLLSGSLLSVFCTIVSFVTALPYKLVTRFWLVYLLVAIPLALFFFFLVLSDVRFNRKK
jgi:hypothetical protein